MTTAIDFLDLCNLSEDDFHNRIIKLIDSNDVEMDEVRGDELVGTSDEAFLNHFLNGFELLDGRVEIELIEMVKEARSSYE